MASQPEDIRPLLLNWMKEFCEEIKGRDTHRNIQLAYNRALDSLSSCAVPIYFIRDCAKLKYIGKGIITRLERKYREHVSPSESSTQQSVFWYILQFDH